MKTVFITFLRALLAKPTVFPLNQHIFKLQLRTIGILNSETESATGEPWFLQQLTKLQPRVIVDVGANDFAYGQDVLYQSYIFAFEPHPTSFKRLLKNRGNKVIPVEAAVGDTDGQVTLWDFADTAPRKADQPTSQLATLHQEIISNLYHQPQKKYRVKSVTLDRYFKNKKIKNIDLLKIDAEGHELAVLKGAKQLLKENKIQIVQFEFNETHAYSRVFVKDFYDILAGFSFYRLLPSGLAPLGEYRPLTHEIFGFQNLVAVHQQSHFAQLIKNNE